MGPGAVKQGSIPASEVVPDSQSAQKTGSIPASEVVPDNPDLIPVTMVGPDGKKQQVAPSDVPSMRQKNFALTPDNPGAQKMLTRQGQVAYALPGEVDDWEKSKSAVRVNPDGSLLVPPGQSEWSQEYRDRHDTYFQAHQNPDVQKALAASDKTQNVAGNVMLGTGVAGNVAVAAPVAVDAGLNYLGRAALPGLEREAGKAILRQGAKWAAKKTAVAGGTYAGIKIAQKTGLIDKLLEFF